jgi:hypothetical protein
MSLAIPESIIGIGTVARSALLKNFEWENLEMERTRFMRLM